ncbi:MAG: hypothetical protein DI548_02850 [Flavobacterium johnsoniae]|nr:MAG: hypothetical protein DI548_02850 [Flavobacterium johnsoniae]
MQKSERESPSPQLSHEIAAPIKGSVEEIAPAEPEPPKNTHGMVCQYCKNQGKPASVYATHV